MKIRFAPSGLTPHQLVSEPERTTDQTAQPFRLTQETHG